MEVGPILRAMTRNKAGAVLIVFEVAVTLAVVLNAIAIIRDYYRNINRPSGMDVDHVVAITIEPFDLNFKEREYLSNVMDEDMRRLRALPGVVDASIICLFPLSGSGWTIDRRAAGKKDQGLPLNEFYMDDRGLGALGLSLSEGRFFTEAEVRTETSGIVVITKSLAEKLFPGKSALGESIEMLTEPNRDRVIGVVDLMEGYYPNRRYVYDSGIWPNRYGSFDEGVRYLVRTEPGKRDALLPGIEQLLLEINDGRIMKIETLAEIKTRTYRDSATNAKMLNGISLVLVIITLFGIYGVAAFSVTQRLRHIGIRRALGARKIDILRLFLVENWLMTSMGLVLGCIMAVVFNNLLMSQATVGRFPWIFLPLGLLCFWVIGWLAVFFPALKASGIDPSSATKSKG